MKEIGSEFWDRPPICSKQNGIFPKTTQWYISGRSALQAIIAKLKSCHKVAIPSWCCDSIIKPFLSGGMEVCFYPVYWDGGLIQEPRFDCDVLLLMDYFGYTSVATSLSYYSGVVIRDVTHSIFSTSYENADYSFGSLRKWCGFWTGGFAWAKDGHVLTIEHNNGDEDYLDLRKTAMLLKCRYINSAEKECSPNEKNEYLRCFKQAEEKLEKLGTYPAVERDIRSAFLLDTDLIKTRRRENARIIMSAFSDWLVFSKSLESDCPMFVPILVPEGRRNELHSYLIKNEIYCPIHWPVSEYHRLDEREQFIYDNELSLVCDQRYTENDMNRMVETIKMFMED